MGAVCEFAHVNMEKVSLSMPVLLETIWNLLLWGTLSSLEEIQDINIIDETQILLGP